MDSHNKKIFDIWQKTQILLKKNDNPSREDLARLQYILLDSALQENPECFESYSQELQSCFEQYQGIRKANSAHNQLLYNNITKKNLQFSLKDFDFMKNEESIYSKENQNIRTNDEINIKPKNEFRSASDEIGWQKRNQTDNGSCPSSTRKNLGVNSSHRGFVSPVVNINVEKHLEEKQSEKNESSDIPEIKGIDKKLVELIMNDIIDNTAPVTWDDIAGLELVKRTVEEIIIWPMVRPDLFTGLLCPVKGLLLFGPPGTGKTLIGKCIANQCKAKFFSISSSSMTSKWFGEGEKLVRALFHVAKHFQPSVIFIDEVDSLLTARKNDEHESTRRIKTEFLVQLDGCGTSMDERILVIGATNRPQELDDAARRRFVKRLYVPLPNDTARCQIIRSLISKQNQCLSDQEISMIVNQSKGYSGADVMNLCKEAALGPIRDVKDISKAEIKDVRPISFNDFTRALKHVKPSVCSEDVSQYLIWNSTYGSGNDEVD